jgi:hypothetical protein
MAFLKRLGFYMIGLTIGLIFLTLFLKKKTSETGSEFCYFPNCRVLKELRSKPLTYSDEAKNLLARYQIDTADVKAFLRHGDIDFGKSNTRKSPCGQYTIDYLIKEKEASIAVLNCDSTIVLESLSFLEKP